MKYKRRILSSWRSRRRAMVWSLWWRRRKMKMKELAILRRMKLLKWRENKKATMVTERGGNDKIILTVKKLYFYIVQPNELRLL